MSSSELREDTTSRMAVAAPSKPFAISFTKTKALSGSKSLGTRKRPHSSIVEEDSDNEDKPPKAQLVSAFDHSVGGAIGINDLDSNKGPLVIQSQKNQFWREGSLKKKGKNLLPAEIQAGEIEKTTQKISAESDQAPQTWGLSFAKPQAMISNGETANAGTNSVAETESDPIIPHTEDDEAMDALLGNGIKKSTLILPVARNHNERMDTWLERGNEDDRIRADVASRPDAASLDEYAAVPVEEFGPAMLRGMGWKEGDAVGNRKGQFHRPREVARRPALLGIGAKEMPGGVEELGAWGSAAKAKRKADKIYNPIMLKNSATGEIISEEELEKRKQNDGLEEQDWKERRDKNLALDSERKERRKHDAEDSLERSNRSRRHRSKSTERSHHSSSKRFRSRSPERDRNSSSRRRRSRSDGHTRHSSSRRDRSRSPRRSHHNSSGRARSRSRDRRHSCADYRRDHEDKRHRNRPG